MQISLEVFGERVLDRELMRYAENAMDLGPFYRWWFRKLRSYEARGFESEGRTLGATWRKLKPYTIAYKAKHWPGRKKLHRTKHLRKTLTTPNEPGAIAEAFASEAVFGSDAPYAQFHQRGTEHMDRRPIIRLTEKAKKQTVKGLQYFLATGKAPANSYIQGL